MFFAELDRGPITTEAAMADGYQAPGLYSRGLDRHQFLVLVGLATVMGVTHRLMAAPATAPRKNERSLGLYNAHTSERLQIVHWQPEGYLEEALAEISNLLCDHHTGEIHPIDPGLLDLLHDLSAVLETSMPFHVLSGFRSQSPMRNWWHGMARPGTACT